MEDEPTSPNLSINLGPGTGMPASASVSVSVSVSTSVSTSGAAGRSGSTGPAMALGRTNSRETAQMCLRCKVTQTCQVVPMGEFFSLSLSFSFPFLFLLHLCLCLCLILNPKHASYMHCLLSRPTHTLCNACRLVYAKIICHASTPSSRTRF